MQEEGEMFLTSNFSWKREELEEKKRKRKEKKTINHLGPYMKGNKDGGHMQVV